ncbi:hypothetical protein IT408_00750 [Candidatus Uhrbacteria bacterium]|nr:hypothetical protein [Candidatus Uhrbacteria bacterium]
MFPRPVHSAGADDATLAREADTFVTAHPPIQILAGLITILREKRPAWHTPETMLNFCPVNERMNAFEVRHDIRQRILTELTGVKAKSALRTPLEMQCQQLLIAIDVEDVSVSEYEMAHQATELALYLDAGALWRHLMQSLPWEQNEDSDKEIIGLLISSLLDSGRAKTEWSPSGAILTPWDLMRGIDSRVWNHHLPLDLRAQVHEAWVQATQDGKETVFAPKHVFAIVTPDIFMVHFKLTDLKKILELAEERMGFKAPPLPTEEGAPSTRFEGQRRSNQPPSAAEVAATETDEAIESLFSGLEEKQTEHAKTAPPPPGSPPPDAMVTLPPSKADISADDEIVIPAPDLVGVASIESVVIDVRDDELEEHDLEEIPPSLKSATAEQNSDTQAVEIARMMVDLEKHGIKTEAEPDKIRRVHSTIEKILGRTLSSDEHALEKVKILALKEELREVLVLFDSAAYSVDRYTKGTVSLGGFIARLEFHLGMTTDKKNSSQSVSNAPPRSRSSGRSAVPPPLPSGGGSDDSS